MPMSSTIGGYAVPYDVGGILVDGSHETIAPGALDFNGDVDLRIGHEGRPLARTGNGLRLSADRRVVVARRGRARAEGVRAARHRDDAGPRSAPAADGPVRSAAFPSASAPGRPSAARTAAGCSPISSWWKSRSSAFRRPARPRVTSVKGAADPAGAAAFLEAVRRAALAIKRQSP